MGKEIEIVPTFKFYKNAIEVAEVIGNHEADWHATIKKLCKPPGDADSAPDAADAAPDSADAAPDSADAAPDAADAAGCNSESR